MSTHVHNCKITFLKVVIKTAQINSIRHFKKNRTHMTIRLNYNYLVNNKAMKGLRSISVICVLIKALTIIKLTRHIKQYSIRKF